MAERLPLFVSLLSLRARRRDYRLSAWITTWTRNWKKDQRRLSGLAFGITWYHSICPRAKSLLDQLGFEVSGVMTTVIRMSFRFLPSSAVFR